MYPSYFSNILREAIFLCSSIEYNHIDTSVGGVYFKSLTLKLQNKNSTNLFAVQNSSFRKNLCYNELADHNIEIDFVGVNAGSYIDKFLIEENEFYGAQTSVILGNSNKIHINLINNTCRKTYFGWLPLTKQVDWYGSVVLI